jgi:dihydroorotase
VTAEATPHHLLLTEDHLENRETAYKVNPPLRNAEDVRALIEAVKDGTIDVFATDHAPHAAKEKALPLEKAPFGMTGLETAVSLLYDRIVGKNGITLARFIEMCSTRPAALLGLGSKGRIAVGADADLTILNLHQDIVVDAGAFESKCRISPYDGWKLRGAPAMTVIGGKIVYPFGS